MKKWEYKVEMIRGNYIQVQSSINKLGQEGWELVSSENQPYNGLTQNFMVIYKKIIN